MNHFTLLKQGIESWNQWRQSHPDEPCSLEGQDLSHGYFFEGNFRGVNLKGANLQRACLVGADFRDADLSNADLTGAYLGDTRFSGANLTHANLTQATLERADMRGANMTGTLLREADLRTSKLPAPSADPVVDRIAELLSQPAQPPFLPSVQVPPQTTPWVQSPVQIPVQMQAPKPPVKSSQQTVVATRPVAETPRVAAQPNAQRSFLNRVTQQLQTFSPVRSESFAERQQRIRLSAMPAPKKTSAQSPVLAAVAQPQISKVSKPKASQPKVPKLKASKLKASKLKTSRPKASKPELSTAELSIPVPPSLKQAEERLRNENVRTGRTRSTKWGRREGDRQLTAQLGWYLSRRVVWIPAAAAIVLGAAVGLPIATDSFAGAPDLVAPPAVASATSLALVKSLTGNSQIWSIATHRHADGSTQVIGGEADGEIQIWDGQTGETLRSLTGHESGVKTLAVSASGQRLVSGGGDGIKVWNPKTGSLVYEVPRMDSAGASAVGSVAIAPDERTFVSSDQNGTITAWDMASGEALYSVASGSLVWSIAIAPNSQTFVSGSSDQTIRQWDIATGSLLQEFTGHSDAVRSVAISPDGQTLASGSWEPNHQAVEPRHWRSANDPRRPQRPNL